MKRYSFKLTGDTPLLMHSDDIEGAERIRAWQDAPENRDLSRPGDDRSPAWGWTTRFYSDGERLVIPSDNLMTCLRDAGTQMILKGRKTYKSITQSGMLIEEIGMPLLVDDQEILVSSLEEIVDNNRTFAEHAQQVKQLGFSLFVKRAKIGRAKHIRVRPRFDKWSVSGTLAVISENELTESVLTKIFDIAGFHKGLGDWRPSSPMAPGAFGKFTTELAKIT